MAIFTNWQTKLANWGKMVRDNSETQAKESVKAVD
jgi:hypothetical protein